MTTRAIATMIAFALWGLGAPGAVAQGLEETFAQANAAYEQGRYEAAAEAYRGLLLDDVRDPIVEYNLGNAEFRLGNLGGAILHYERARRLDPLDPDIRANLEFARSHCLDRVDAGELATFVRWLRAAQNRLGPDRQAWFALASIWCIVALVAWCFSRPGRWSATHGWVLAVFLALFVVSASSWFMTLQRIEGKRSAVVLVEVVEVLAGPGYSNATLFTIHEGLTLEIRSEREEWLQVSLPNGLNGWIAREAVGEI